MKLWLRLLVAALVLGVWGEELWAQAGPRTDSSSTVARPRKKEDKAEEPQGDKIPSKLNPRKKDQPSDGLEDAGIIRSDAITVQVDVAVLTNNGQFIPGLTQGVFRVTEDGVPQQVKTFAQGEAPMTVALVIEFSAMFHQYWVGPAWQETLVATYGLVETFKPEDYVAVIAFDLKPEMLSDFTNNRQETLAALGRLRIPGFRDINTFDALADTVDRMSQIEGRKAVILVGSGLDTFSKLTFDKARKIIQQSGVPIYAIGTMQALRIIYEQYMDPAQRLDFLQADNQLRTFAKETGGQAWFPRFFGEFPNIYNFINQSLRNQYQLTYQSTNPARDGKYRRIKVELMDPATNQPIRVTDQNGKPVKYQIVAKQGYTAPREVE
jgi:VWFA-related protein